MQITDHFALEEFHSRAHGDVAAEKYPADWIPDRLRPLCYQLELIRAAAAGRAVRILSGYRSPALNRALPGTAKNSQHMYGRAADIVIPGVRPDDVHALVLELAHQKRITIGGLGYYTNFTHVDIRPTDRLVRWTGSAKRA